MPRVTNLEKLARLSRWACVDWGYWSTHRSRVLTISGPGGTITIERTLRWSDTRGGRGKFPDPETGADWLRTVWLPARAEPVVITEPTLMPMSDEAYFADPVPGGSLTQSRAKVLLGEGGPKTIRDAIDHKKLPARKSGVKVVILADDLREWLRSLPPARD